MTRNIFLFYLIIISLLLNCTGNWGRVRKISKDPDSTSIEWQFKLQPYKNSKIYINNTLITPKILTKDNSLALLSVKLTENDFNQNNVITIRHQGFITRIITADEIINTLPAMYPPLYMLDKTASKHRYYTSWATGKQPKSVTFIDDTRIAVPLLSDSGIDIINIHTGRTVRIKPPPEFAKYKGFVESMVDHSNNELWISQMNTGRIHVFNLTTLQYKRSVKLTGKWTKVILNNPFKGQVYCANWLSKTISVINKTTYKETSSLNAYGVPRGMILSKDGSYLYICQYGMENEYDRHGTIVKINVNTGKFVQKIGPPGVKRHIVDSKDHAKYFVSDMHSSSIYIFESQTEKLIKKVRVFSHPNTIAISPDGICLYVSCRGRNNPASYHLKGFHMGRIYVINTKLLKVTEFWEGGNQCTGLDISPDGKYVVFSDFLDNTVRVYKIINR